MYSYIRNTGIIITYVWYRLLRWKTKHPTRYVILLANQKIVYTVVIYMYSQQRDCKIHRNVTYLHVFMLYAISCKTYLGKVGNCNISVHRTLCN